MSERIVRENGKTYIVNQYGDKRSPNFGTDVTEDMINTLPLAVKIASFGAGKLAGVMQAAASKVLTDEEYAQLEAKQSTTQDKHENSIFRGIQPQSMKEINDANSKGNHAIVAMGKHFAKKAVNGVGKLINKEDDSNEEKNN